MRSCYDQVVMSVLLPSTWALVLLDVPRLTIGSSQINFNAGVTAGWCNQDLPAVTSMATDVVDHSYGGMFYWSNLDTPASATYYDTTYAIVKQ